MARYHFLDESGDPSFDETASSRYFVLAMVQLNSDDRLPQLTELRRLLYLPSSFEFKYYKARPHQKVMFFEVLQSLMFSVRAAVVDKSRLETQIGKMNGLEFTSEFITRLIIRSPAATIANDVLVIDEATPSLVRSIRTKLSIECRTSAKTFYRVPYLSKGATF